MFVKTTVILAAFAASYVLLTFIARTWWQALPLAVLVGCAAAAIGFNVQHDAGHQAYSSRPWVNKLMAMSLDLMGGSSYFWHWKHGVIHHTFVNITGHDADIDLGILGRLTPHQKWHPVYRWQHVYLWALYGLMMIKWHLYSDFRDFIVGRLGAKKFPRPQGWDLVVFVGGKLLFLSLAFGIPLLFHPAWAVLLFYGITALVLGVVLSVVFQLAHCVEAAHFPLPLADSGRMEHTWALHQVQTTVDFARRSRVALWFLGGLNFQVEHHLFPRVCHLNYPAISVLVEQTCREHGVRFLEHPSFLAGVAAHFRWLRRMGARPSSPRATPSPIDEPDLGP